MRDAHELASNQYLVVKVYGEVDEAAPYYEVTARSAAIVHATAENVSGEGGKGTRPKVVKFQLRPDPLAR